MPLPDSLIPEPEPIPVRSERDDADSGVAMRYAIFSPSPPTRLSLPYLSVVRNALEDASRGDLTEEERDLVILAADLWVRSVSASEGAAAQIADSLRDLGARFEGPYYCGTLLEPLAERPDSTPWASRAFVVLLEQGWLGACRFDFGEHAFGSDLFIAVIEHGERFLAAHPRSPIRDAVALRVALAHETSWSIDKWDSEYFFHESWDAGAERQRAIALYEGLVQETPDGALRKAIEDRLQMLRRNKDTGCRVYYLESGC